MSEEKKRRGASRKFEEGEPREDEAAGSPNPMGTGNPEAGDSGPMGTEAARNNEDAASHDTADEGDD